jgi:hypothetical protein
MRPFSSGSEEDFQRSESVDHSYILPLKSSILPRQLLFCLQNPNLALESFMLVVVSRRHKLTSSVWLKKFGGTQGSEEVQLQAVSSKTLSSLRSVHLQQQAAVLLLKLLIYVCYGDRLSPCSVNYS